MLIFSPNGMVDQTLAVWIIMPTDLGAASERKRKAAHAEAQTEITVMLVMVIISLVILVLLVADQNFSKASIELLGRLAP
jgi:uncharacterized integral membrane protein